MKLKDTDIIALIESIAEFIISYTPTNKENALHSLKILVKENKLFSQHTKGFNIARDFEFK